MNRYSNSILPPLLKKWLWVWLLGSVLPVGGEEVPFTENSRKMESQTTLPIPHLTIQENLLESSLGLSSIDFTSSEPPVSKDVDGEEVHAVRNLSKPKIKRLGKAPQRKSKSKPALGFSLGLEPQQVENALTKTEESTLPVQNTAEWAAKTPVVSGKPEATLPITTEPIEETPRFSLGLDSLEILLEEKSSETIESVNLSQEEILPKWEDVSTDSTEDVSPSQSLSVVTASWEEPVKSVSVIQVSYSEELDFLDITPPQNHQEATTSTQKTLSLEAVPEGESMEKNSVLEPVLPKSTEEETGKVQISNTSSKLLISPMVMKNRLEQMRAQQKDVTEGNENDKALEKSETVETTLPNIGTEEPAVVSEEEPAVVSENELLPELKEIETEIPTLETTPATRMELSETTVQEPLEKENAASSESIPEVDIEAWIAQIAEKTVDRLSDTLLEKAVDQAAQRILQQMEKKLAEKVEKLATAKVASLLQEKSFQRETPSPAPPSFTGEKKESDTFSFEVTAIEKAEKEVSSAPPPRTSTALVKKVPNQKILEETFPDAALPELSELPELPELPELGAIPTLPAVQESSTSPALGNQASTKEETPGFIKISGRKKGNRESGEKEKKIPIQTTSLEEPDETAGFVRIGSKAKKSSKSSKEVTPQTKKLVTRETPSEKPLPTPQEMFQEVRLTPCNGVVLNTQSDILEIRMSRMGHCDTVEISPRQISLIGKQLGETVLQIFFQETALAPMTLRVTVESGNSEETRWIQWCGEMEKRVQEKTGATVSVFLFQNRVFLKGKVSATSTTEVITQLLQEEFVRFQQENQEILPDKKMLLVNLLQVKG